MEGKRFYTDKQLALYLGIGKSTVWAMTKDKRLPEPLRTFGTRWDIQEVLKYIK